MFLLRVYEKWRGISFLGDNFSAVARGRNFCVLILVYLGSAFVGLCRRVLVFGRKLLLMVLCRKSDCLSWGYWCPCWGYWPGCGYTAGRCCLPIISLSWLFLGTLCPDRVPWQTLTKWSGWPPFCVRTSISLRQSKLCLTSGIWLPCERRLFFFEALPRLCSMVCHVLFLSTDPVR